MPSGDEWKCEICSQWKDWREFSKMTTEGEELLVCEDCAAKCCRVGHWRAR